MSKMFTKFRLPCRRLSRSLSSTLTVKEHDLLMRDAVHGTDDTLETDITFLHESLVLSNMQGLKERGYIVKGKV